MVTINASGDRSGEYQDIDNAIADGAAAATEYINDGESVRDGLAKDDVANMATAVDAQLNMNKIQVKYSAAVAIPKDQLKKTQGVAQGLEQSVG